MLVSLFRTLKLKKTLKKRIKVLIIMGTLLKITLVMYR